MVFADFLGNKEVKKLLDTAFVSGRFPHAVILQGASGCGKRTLAKMLAQALVCRNKEEAPCGVCPSCIRARAGTHPDIRIEEGSGVTRSLSTQTVKDIGVDIYKKPEEANVNCYLIFIENKISEAAQNKLLKMIEEPAPNTVFIITISSAQSLLPTVRSRVQIYTLNPPKAEEAAEYVAQKLGVSMEQSLALAKKFGGNIGQILNSANDESEKIQAFDMAAKIVDKTLGSGEYGLIELTAPLIKDKQLFREVLTKLIPIFRDACVLRAGGKIMISGADNQVSALQTLTMKKLSLFTDLAEDFKQKIDTNVNMTLLITDFCAKMRSAAGK